MYSAATLMALSLAAALSASADTIPFTSAGVEGCTGTSPQSCSQEVVGASNVNTTLTAGTGTATMSGTAQAGYGILQASSAESFSGSATPVFSYLDSYASFFDNLTISFAPFTGETGYLSIGFSLVGTNAQTGSLNAEASLQAVLGMQSSALGFTSSAPPGPGVVFFPETFSFVFGQPIDFIVNLGTVAGSFNPGSDGSIGPYQTTVPGTASSYFADTFILNALDVTDAQGNIVSGVTFSSESGTQYSTDGVVPEPSSRILVLSGLLSLVALRRVRLREIRFRLARCGTAREHPL
jgi:hypothetical protein